MNSFIDRLNYAAQFCIRRAGTGNRASTRALCNCIEQPDGVKLMAALVRRAHRNGRLADGVRLMFNVESINAAAASCGVPPLVTEGVPQRAATRVAPSNKAVSQLLYCSPTRAWVGEFGVQQDANLCADVPDVDDVRWRAGVPTVLDEQVLTLSPFFPSGRLGVCFEKKDSVPKFPNANHPPFQGVVAWMPMHELVWRST